MSWLQKLLPPRISSTPGGKKTPVPEGLWIKCSACEAVLYRTDLEKNLFVCPKCNFHVRVPARERIVEHELDRRCDVLLSPSHGQLEPRELADWILADRLPVRMQVQLHKLLWGDTPGR